MKTYAIYFNGHYPVGAVAIVVAATREAAVAALHAELVGMGLRDCNPLAELDSAEVQQLDTTTPGVHVLLDGDY